MNQKKATVLLFSVLVFAFIFHSVSSTSQLKGQGGGGDCPDSEGAYAPTCPEYECIEIYSGRCAGATTCDAGETAVSGVVCNDLNYACCVKSSDDGGGGGDTLGSLGGGDGSCSKNTDCALYKDESACATYCSDEGVEVCPRDVCSSGTCTSESFDCLEYECEVTLGGSCSGGSSCESGFLISDALTCSGGNACCVPEPPSSCDTPDYCIHESTCHSDGNGCQAANDSCGSSDLCCCDPDLSPPSPGPAPSPGTPPIACPTGLVCSLEVTCTGPLNGVCGSTGCNGSAGNCCCDIGVVIKSGSIGSVGSTGSTDSGTSASAATTTSAHSTPSSSSSSSSSSSTFATPLLGWCCNDSTCSEQRMDSCTGTPYFSEKACNDYCAPSCERCGDGCTDDPFWAVCPEPTPSRIVTCEYAEGVCQDTATALRSTFCPPPEPACTATSVPYCSALALWVCWDTAIHGTLQDGSIPASYTSAPTPPTASPGTPTSHFPGISRFLASMLTATASVKCDSATVPDCSSKTPICCPQGRWTCWDQQTEPLPNCSSPDVSLSPSPTSSLPRTILFATIVVSIGYCFACRSEQKKL